MSDGWTDPTHPPTFAAAETLRDLGGGVWSVFLDGKIHLWHWCDRTAITRNGQESWWFEPRWNLAGAAGHDLVSRDPLTLNPSVLWSDCCGLHGYVRNGSWERC